ncbi:MAG: PAS domain S-box protein, partial [Cyanobacteria bacterium]|nr:PAS domain S-box protein [Cyanobacteriota bacterium]MDW8202125.1 PAS domain S-box protein [Cyanobacteriota bacterium SKYGB_h_bin112]
TIVGMLSEQDLVHLYQQTVPLDQLPVHTVMHQLVVTCPASALVDIATILALFQHHQIYHLPVVDADDRLIGLLTPDRIMHLLAATNPTAIALTTTQFVETQAEFVARSAADTTITFANSALCCALGKSPTEIVGMQWGEVVPLEDMAILKQKIAAMRPDRPIMENINRNRRASGQLGWTQWVNLGIFDDQGNLIEIQSVGRDITRLRETEQALRQSETLFRNAFNSSAIGMALVSPNWQFLKVNAALCEFLGYDAADLLELTIWNVIYSPDAAASQTLYDAVLAGNNHSFNVEQRLVTSQGQVVWGRSTASLVRDDHNQPLYFVVQIQDIDVRKRAELWLSQQADREHIVNTITQKIRASLNLVDILNAAVTELQEVLRADRVLVYRVLPNGSGQVIAEATLPELPVILDKIFPEETFPQENYQRYIQGRVYALTDREHGPVLPCLAKFLHSINVRAKLVVPIVDKDSLWGLVIAHQCHTPRQWRPWEIKLLQEIASQLTIAIQQSQLYAQLQTSHEQLLRANDELLRATRLKDEFLANMSHELRTPLNAILGMTEGLQEQIFGAITTAQKNALQTIERSASHLLTLINDILDLAKIESGQMELELAPTAIVPLCESCLIFIQQQAFKKQIHIATKFPPHLPELCLDERRIRQAVINLLSNAVKFTPEHGRITLEVSLHHQVAPTEAPPLSGITRVRTYRTPLEQELGLGPQSTPLPPHDDLLIIHNYVRIAVTDTGIGMTPDQMDKLFQPFVQIDSALNRKYEGTGLGLALVKRIVDLHGGQVGVTSEIGVGSCFMIDLPYRSATVTKSISEIDDPCNSSLAIDSTAPQQPTAYRILLAEDNDANVLSISSYLKAKGYSLLIARDGQEVVNLAQQEQPDLILMDIQMPVMDGLEAMQHIRRHPTIAATPIIALTALAMEHDRDRCLAAGATDYLSKPVKLKQLLAMIEHQLHHKSA